MAILLRSPRKNDGRSKLEQHGGFGSASKERILKRSCGFFITPVDRILIHLKRYRRSRTKMALTRVLLRRRKSLSSFARESCLSRSMVLGLIVFSLPMLMGCAAEGVAELVQALEIRGLIVAGFGGSGPPEAEPITQVNAADESAVTPEGELQSGSPEAEPITQVNAADESTVTPEGSFQNEPTEAEPTYSPF